MLSGAQLHGFPKVETGFLVAGFTFRLRDHDNVTMAFIDYGRGWPYNLVFSFLLKAFSFCKLGCRR
jgi:hypothetical protein